jgi:hypothetical protein
VPIFTDEVLREHRTRASYRRALTRDGRMPDRVTGTGTRARALQMEAYPDVHNCTDAGFAFNERLVPRYTVARLPAAGVQSVRARQHR